MYGTRRRSGDRRAAPLVIALTALACSGRADHRAIDAAADVAPPIDAPASVPADAAAPPPPVPTHLVAAGDSTCAVLSDRTVRCWGGNAHGQLGNGLTTDATRPVTPALRAVVDLQLADATACAVLDDTSVACWGRIGWHGHPEDVLQPTGVAGVTGVKQLFVLAGRACARVIDDSLVCWGNTDARGHFAAGPTNRAPTPVVGLDHIAAIRAEGAISDDGTLWYWTRDGVPRRLDASGVQEIATRDGTICGRLQTGRVVCAPSERCGSRPPRPAASKPSAPIKPPRAATTAATTKSAKPRPPRPSTSQPAPAPGKSPPSNQPAPAAPAKSPPSSTQPAPAAPGEPADPLGFTSARQLAFDLGFCVVTTTNKLQCGDGCRQIDPVKLERVDSVIGRCARLRSGTVTCFHDGQATAIPGVTRATLLAVGRAHACAFVDGRIACWGDDDHGQLGGFAIAR
jgi:hypothetical protein